MSKQNVYEIVTEQVLAALEKGTVPWRKPWNPAGAHQNLDGRAYRGVNQLLLEIAADQHGFDLPFWTTMKGANRRGGKVMKGSKSTIVTFWKSYTDTDENGDERKRFFLRYYRVFNVAQIEGMNWTAPTVEKVDHDPIAAGEKIIAGMPNPPKITIKSSDRAYYAPMKDEIVLPQMEQYGIAADYYRVAFHEMIHATGHESRLDRGLMGWTETEDYAAEELVAELGAAMLCGVAGIDADVEQSAAYIAGWRKALSDDPRLIVSAASKAQKGADYILGGDDEDGDED